MRKGARTVVECFSVASSAIINAPSSGSSLVETANAPKHTAPPEPIAPYVTPSRLGRVSMTPRSEFTSYRRTPEAVRSIASSSHSPLVSSSSLTESSNCARLGRWDFAATAKNCDPARHDPANPSNKSPNRATFGVIAREASPSSLLLRESPPIHADQPRAEGTTNPATTVMACPVSICRSCEGTQAHKRDRQSKSRIGETSTHRPPTETSSQPETPTPTRYDDRQGKHPADRNPQE